MSVPVLPNTVQFEPLSVTVSKPPINEQKTTAKVAPVRAMKAYTGSRGKTPLILNRVGEWR